MLEIYSVWMMYDLLLLQYNSHRNSIYKELNWIELELDSIVTSSLQNAHRSLPPINNVTSFQSFSKSTVLSFFILSTRYSACDKMFLKIQVDDCVNAADHNILLGIVQVQFQSVTVIQLIVIKNKRKLQIAPQAVQRFLQNDWYILGDVLGQKCWRKGAVYTGDRMVTSNCGSKILLKNILIKRSFLSAKLNGISLLTAFNSLGFSTWHSHIEASFFREYILRQYRDRTSRITFEIRIILLQHIYNIYSNNNLQTKSIHQHSFSPFLLFYWLPTGFQEDLKKAILAWRRKQRFIYPNVEEQRREELCFPYFEEWR